MKKIAIVIFLIALVPLSGKADIHVIVHKDNAINSLNKKQTIDIFMGRTRSFADGTRAYTIDQPVHSKTRATFYKSLTGKSVTFVNAYWARLFYTGRRRPPADHFKTSEDILAEVSKNVHAIAYFEGDTLPKNTKIVLTLEN